ncbi:MAG: CRISPR system precrRNA processing endoribonuclease RAMP protein Cas6, partial [Anaerolineae bacterium]
IEAVLFVYPGKLTYGQGELILWELKLLGESADHGFFLEVILPAMEEVGGVSNPEWQRTNTLWGRFDVHAVYAARGPRWEPVVSDGRLNLQYRATPVQWAEGLIFDWESERIPDRLTWQTPFDLGSGANTSGSSSKRHSRKQISSDQVPTLQRILESLIARMSVLLPGKHHPPDEILNVLSAEERESFQTVMEQACRIPIRHARYEPAPKYWPGRWIGTQNFAAIPRPIIPYLELASILHIGKQTHFGCGTFAIT